MTWYWIVLIAFCVCVFSEAVRQIEKLNEKK